MCSEKMNTVSGKADGSRFAGVADAAGVVGSVTAALCCAGTPWIVGAFAAVGLAFLRRDSILWPVMLLSLAAAVWGFWQGRSFHHSIAPLVMGTIGAISLAAGVIFVHGPPAITMIYAGAVLLVGATAMNILLRVRAARPRMARSK